LAAAEVLVAEVVPPWELESDEAELDEPDEDSDVVLLASLPALSLAGAFLSCVDPFAPEAEPDRESVR